MSNINFNNNVKNNYFILDECFFNLATESKSLDNFNIASGSGSYDFCSKPDIVLCNNDYITSIYFQFPYQNSSFILKPSNIYCFKNLTILSITNVNISSDFLYTKFKDLTSLTLNSTEYITINNIIPSINSFSIGSESRNVQNLNFKYFLNVKNLYISCLVSSFINDNNGPLLGDLESIDLNIVSYPNLTNFNSISKVSFNLGPSFDMATSRFIYTFNSVTELTITSESCKPFPIEIGNLNSNKMELIKFKGCLSNPSKLIDLSNVTSFENFKISFDNSQSFCFSGNCSFPFSKLPKMTEFSMNGGTVYEIKDFNIFENVGAVLLENNKIQSNLGIKNSSSPELLDLRNNLIFGDLDNSWCTSSLYVSNNRMTGMIPSCFKCYFVDLITKSYFSGNQFINYETNEPCTTITPSNLYIKNNVIYINGTDLILNSGQIKSIPNLQWSIITLSKLISAPINDDIKSGLLKTIDLIILDNYKFTMSLIQQAPLISNITHSSSSSFWVIKGSYFTNDKSMINFKIGGNDCLVVSTSFYEIECTFLPSVIFPTDGSNQTSTFKIGNYPEIKLYLNTNLNFVNQMCSPECNNQVTCNMITSTCSSCIDGGVSCLNGGSCDFNSNSCKCLNGYFGESCEKIQCNSNCNELNGGGKCDFTTGECICSSIYWTGLDCNITNHYVTGISSTTIEGGLINLYGQFGDVHNSPSVLIGNLNCIINQINNTLITCNLPSTTNENYSGTFKNVIVIQNSIEWKGLNYFKYLETFKQCPKNCIDSNHGICNLKTSSCNCNSKWSGLDCAIPIITDTTTQSNTTINESTGETNINNQNTNYQILITSINELNFDNQIIKSFQLQGNWNFLNSSKSNQDDGGNTITYFSQQFNNNQTTIISTIEEVSNNNGKQYSFAGVDFKVEKGSLKFTISIQNWKYDSILNTLRLEMKSTVNQYNIDNCKESTKISINGGDDDSDSNNLNYMTISKGDKIMYGRFIDKALSDSKSTFIKSQVISQDNDSLIIGLNLPHCIECIVDPDFSVLVNPQFQSSCSNNNNKSRNWVIPVAVVVSVVGFSLLIALIFILYKKNSTLVKIHISSLKLSKLKK